MMAKNGNGTAMLQRTALATTPAWILRMRQAARRAVTADDLVAIVQKQVERAKAGDERAIRFVFDQLLSSPELKGLTFVQNNYTGGPRPDGPPAGRPGSAERIEQMRRRVEAGFGAFDEDVDGRDEEDDDS